MKGSPLADTTPVENRIDCIPSSEHGHTLLALKEPSCRFGDSGHSFLPHTTSFSTQLRLKLLLLLGWLQLSQSWSKQHPLSQSLHDHSVKDYSNRVTNIVSSSLCVGVSLLNKERLMHILSWQKHVSITGERRGFSSNHSSGILMCSIGEM